MLLFMNYYTSISDTEREIIIVTIYYFQYQAVSGWHVVGRAHEYNIVAWLVVVYIFGN